MPLSHVEVPIPLVQRKPVDNSKEAVINLTDQDLAAGVVAPEAIGVHPADLIHDLDTISLGDADMLSPRKGDGQTLPKDYLNKNLVKVSAGTEEDPQEIYPSDVVEIGSDESQAA